MAGRHVAFAKIFEEGRFVSTAVHGFGATRVEMAALGRIDRIRDIAGQDDPLSFHAGVWYRDRR